MPLNIVILGPAHPFRGGGITTFNERLATELQSAGHLVRIVNFSVQYPSILFPGKSQLTDEPAPPGLTIVRMLHSMNPISWVRTGRYLNKLKPDLIIVRFWLPLMAPAFGTVLKIAKKNNHSRIIAITDNVIPHEKRFGDKALTHYFIGACDAFVTMSENVLNDLKNFNATKPAIQLHHPLYDNFGEKVTKSTAKKWLDIPDEMTLILFFGFIRKYKGLDILLEAMQWVDRPDVRLLIAGEFYDDPAYYRNIISRYGLMDKVILKNSFIPNEEVRYYFSAADLVVQPYRNATQSGVTPLAYHFEKPMVVTNVGSLPDYVPHLKAGLVAEAEPKSIANAINEFLQLGESYFKEGVEAEKKKLGWGHFAKAIEELYQKIKN